MAIGNYRVQLTESATKPQFLIKDPTTPQQKATAAAALIAARILIFLGNAASELF
ncbi:hypothetical protein [Dyella acidisoli]|uniref:Uncharacterized protein n=1 Tax=Dyella acidisoli TaxID=1867834 RepID=A0ABQ5XYR7_9GAMM|nr:hypothetical protein [Dyella acidisoli]GLQ95533.1 hypothetical protein GCM10007901_44890 [Dyella acidisoli]